MSTNPRIVVPKSIGRSFAPTFVQEPSQPELLGQTSIRIVDSESERQQIYRFRYEVYVEGMKRDKHVANHAERKLTDFRDSTATILGAFNEDHVVGTGRINFSSNGSLGEEELFGFSQFSEFSDQLSLTSKLLVGDELRGTRLYLNMACKFCEIAYDRGVILNFLITASDLLPLFSRLGFQKYREGREWLDYGYMNPMVLDFRDLDHLRKVKSPFYEILLKRKESKLRGSGINERIIL